MLIIFLPFFSYLKSVPSIMKFLNKKSISSIGKQTISLMVLVGFLSIQFHSLSHIDLGIVTNHEISHQTENDFSEHGNHIVQEQSLHVDCPACILTKHLQVDLFHDSPLHVNSSFQVTAIHQLEPAVEFSHHIYQLRAPPFAPFDIS